MSIGLVLVWSSTLYGQSITTIQVQAYMQGFWNGTTHVPVAIAVELRSGSQLNTSTLVARSTAMLSTTGSATVTFSNLSSGTYWIVLRCGGHLPVASSSATLITSGSTVTWDFRNPANVYNGSLALVALNGGYGLRTSDWNGDRNVNISDVLMWLLHNGQNNPGQVPAP